MVKPIDAKLYHAWIGRTKNDVVKGVNNLKFLNIFIFHVSAIEKKELGIIDNCIKIFG